MANKKPPNANKQERTVDETTPNTGGLLRAQALEIAAPIVEPLEAKDRDRVLELLARILATTSHPNDRFPYAGASDRPHLSEEGAA